MGKIEIGSVVFDCWTVIEKIGAGSFGTVYKIRKNHEMGITPQYSALKVIYLPEDEQDVLQLKNMGMDLRSIRDSYKEEAEKIFQEINIMYPLKGHGNIVAYEDSQILSQESGIGYVILIRMELLTPLNRYISQHPMNEQQILQLGIDLCQALEACEARKILHRDVKPDNIYMSDFGTFKLGDFGIARISEGTTTGTKTGTYMYMAPEIYNGIRYNATVDLYSLGIILYQYLNGGRLPFMPTDEQKVTAKDIQSATKVRFSGDPVPPIKGIDPALSAIICKACAYNFRDRYQSAADLKTDLLNYQKQSSLPTGTIIAAPSEAFDYETETATEKTVLIGQDVPSSLTESPNENSSKEYRKKAIKNSSKISEEKAIENSSPKGRRRKSLMIAAGLSAATLLTIAGIIITTAFKSPDSNSSSSTSASDDKAASSAPEIGETVTYGTYEQDNDTDDGAEEIEWIVLDVQGNQALLLSKYGLDVKPYNDDDADTDWENCTLRDWLNHGFMNTAFSAEEQKGILRTTIINDDNPEYGTEGGNNTEDYIFCLSLEEADQYFDSQKARICHSTDYAIAQGAYLKSDKDYCIWWLRSPGLNAINAADVDCNGALRYRGPYTNSTGRVVRPALWISISELE